MNENLLYAVDWTAIGIVSLVIFMPLLLVFLYLCYRRYLQSQRRRANDELILKLARDGQALTPDIIQSIRQEEDKKDSDNKPINPYEKICTGVALIIGGLVVLIRNRVFAIVMIVCGLFLAAQGLAIYLSNRKQESTNE